MDAVKHLQWRVHLPRLIVEILQNPSCAILRQPLLITRSIIAEVATRASELNDPKLNELMLRLALYEKGDPESPNYDPSALDAMAALCEDEGCPQHGTPHVCTPSDRLTDAIETAELAPGEQWKDD